MGRGRIWLIVAGAVGCTIPNPAFDGETEGAADTVGATGDGGPTADASASEPSTGVNEGSTGDVPAVCEADPPSMGVRFELEGTTCGLTQVGIQNGLYGNLERVAAGQWNFYWCEDQNNPCGNCSLGPIAISFFPAGIEPTEVATGCAWLRYEEGISQSVTCGPHLLEIKNVELDRLVYAAGWAPINPGGLLLLPMGVRVGDMKIDCRCDQRPDLACCEGTRIDPGFYELVVTTPEGNDVIVPLGDFPGEFSTTAGSGPGTYAVYNHLTYAPPLCEDDVVVEWYMHLRPP